MRRRRIHRLGRRPAGLDQIVARQFQRAGLLRDRLAAVVDIDRPVFLRLQPQPGAERGDDLDRIAVPAVIGVVIVEQIVQQVLPPDSTV